MQEQTPTKKKKAAPRKRELAPRKLKMLFTIVNRKKAEFYADFLQSFDVNAQFMLTGNGTATSDHLKGLTLIETEKTVICSLIRDDKAAEALTALEEKFKTVRGGKGVAYTVPLSGVIGIAIYRFLTDNRTN